MVGQLIRSSGSAILWSFGVLLVTLANVLLCMEHYLSIKTAVDFTNMDSMPLSNFAVLGPFIGSVFAGATLSDFLAGAIVLGEAVGLFFLFHSGFSVLRLREDRVYFRAARDTQNVARATTQIWSNLLVIFFLGALLGVILSYDLGLYRYRAVVGAMGIEDPAEAASSVATWAWQMEHNSDLFAWSLAGVGAWAYLASTVVLSLALERAGGYATVAWVNVIQQGVNVIPQIVKFFESTEPVPHSDDRDVQPVDDADLEIGYDAQGNLIEGKSDEVEHAEASAELTDTIPVDSDAPPTTEESSADKAPGSLTALGGAAPGEANNATPVRTGAITVQRPRVDLPAAEVLLDVIGGKNGEKVTLAAAMADKSQYFVDAETHDVWRAEWRRALMNGQVQPERMAAESEEGNPR